MRDIKFRGETINKGEMVYGYLCKMFGQFRTVKYNALK